MAVDDDVDLVARQHAQVYPAAYRLRRAEQDVGHCGSNRRTYPAIGQAALQAGQDEVLVVVIDAHVGAVHQLNHGGVDAVRVDAQLGPQRLPFFRGQL